MTGTCKTPEQVLHAFPFFADVDEPTFAELVAGSHSRHYAKDEVLFFDGEPCKGLFLVQSGAVKIFKLNDSGREQIIHIQRPGDAVAELPLFDNGPYPASAAAMDDAVVLFIPKTTFHDLLARHPQLGQTIIAALAKRLRSLVALVENLSLRQVRQRLVRLLLEEAQGTPAFQLDFTNEELAARLGSVRDVISRTLSGLQADGLIRLTGRRVEIINPRAMADEAG